jgi:hypothetical protein
MRFLLICLFCFGFATAWAQDPAGSYRLQFGVRIPLPSGENLHATMYAPASRVDGKQRYPVLFTLTPYSADSYHERAAYFARYGYIFLLVDTRGRGNSEGSFDPLRQEAEVASQVVSWLAKQAFSNGEVSMWGGSYAGYNQWMAASKQPEGLFTIVPVASPYPPLDFPTAANLGYTYVMQWLTLTSGKLSQNNLFGDADFWRIHAMTTYKGEKPFAALDEVVGNPSPIFKEWITHPMQDSYWDAFVPTDAELSAINLPILSVTGTYDGDQPGALEFYRRHMALANTENQARHYLLIGPWDHAGTRTPKAEFGGLKFGDASLLDMNKLHVDWYNFARGKGERPELLKDKVVYYVSGLERWQSASSLAAVTLNEQALYLSSEGFNPDRATRIGDLRARADQNSDSDRFRYDPLDFSRAELIERAGSEPLRAQEVELSFDGDGLLYLSEVFTADTVLAGRPRAALYLSCDVPDTDVALNLHEISANGEATLLSSDAVRLRYRDSLRSAKPMPKNKVVRVDFGRFNFFAHRVKQGSRLRLSITAPNSPGVQKNFNSGGEVAFETAKDARVANVRIHLGVQHPSELVLPMGEPQAE